MDIIIRFFAIYLRKVVNLIKTENYCNPYKNLQYYQ